MTEQYGSEGERRVITPEENALSYMMVKYNCWRNNREARKTEDGLVVEGELYPWVDSQ